MPPIRSQSSQKLATQEGKILLALSDLQNNHVKSIHTAAKLYNILYRTLATRANGRAAYIDKYLSDHKLIQLEENLLAE